MRMAEWSLTKLRDYETIWPGLFGTLMHVNCDRAVNDALPLLRKVQEVVVVRTRPIAPRPMVGSMTSCLGSMAMALPHLAESSIFPNGRNAQALPSMHVSFALMESIDTARASAR